MDQNLNFNQVSRDPAKNKPIYNKLVRSKMFWAQQNINITLILLGFCSSNSDVWNEVPIQLQDFSLIFKKGNVNNGVLFEVYPLFNTSIIGNMTNDIPNFLGMWLLMGRRCWKKGMRINFLIPKLSLHYSFMKCKIYFCTKVS